MSGGPRSAGSDENIVWLVIAGVAASATGVLSVGALSAEGVTWLLEHGVLVSEGEALLRLPGGAGLDLRRLALLMGLVLLLGAGGFLGFWRGRDARPAREAR